MTNKKTMGEALKGSYRTKKLKAIAGSRIRAIILIAFLTVSVFGLLQQNYLEMKHCFSQIRVILSKHTDSIDISRYLATYYRPIFNRLDGDGEDSAEYYFDNARLEELAFSQNMQYSELSVVDNRGIVAYSSNKKFIGTDLHESRQLAPFLCLLKDQDAFMTDLSKNPFDGSIELAYIGASFRNHSGFLLIGISEQNYLNELKDDIAAETQTVRIGLTGYILCCTPERNIIAVTQGMEEKAGDVFDKPELLPGAVGEFKETVTELYGVKCYVGATYTGDYYAIGAYPVNEADQFRLQNNILLVGLFLVLLWAFFAAVSEILNRTIIREVEKTHDSLKLITEGDLDEKVDAGGSLEFEALSSGINGTVGKLKGLIAAENERVRRELDNARIIQESSVPRDFPKDERFGLYASMNAALAVGGDFYDFFMRDEKTLVMVIADVSEKGMPAALYMMQAKTLIRTFAEQGLPVEEVAREANLALCEEKSAGMFVTVWIGFLDLSTGIISFVHAGHTRPVISRNGEAFLVDQKKDLVLGGLKKAKYTRQEITLSKGDSIFLYTDGVTESRDVSNRMYGEDRLIDLIRDNAKPSENDDKNAFAKQSCGMVFDDVMNFASGAPQYDDITMMWIRY